MNIQEYLSRRNAITEQSHRVTCRNCWKAIATCFCAEIRPFESPIPFVIVQHLHEARNPIATGRMAHLSITNSKLIIDNKFSNNRTVEALIADRGTRNLMLYPSPNAAPIEQILAETTAAPNSQPPTFWILDTIWSHVNKMLRLSPALRSIPMVQFKPDSASRFQIRQQPDPECLSTIESIYLVIDRFLKHQQSQSTDHHALIDVFQYMVQQQIRFVSEKNNRRHLMSQINRLARDEQRLA